MHEALRCAPRLIGHSRNTKKNLPKDPEALLRHKAPPEMQERISELLELNREGRASPEDLAEMEQIRKLELKILGLKAKALQKRNSEM